MNKYTISDMAEAAVAAAEYAERNERPSDPLVTAQVVAQIVAGNVVVNDGKIRVYVDGRDVAGKDARGCFEVTPDCDIVGRFYTSVSRDKQHPRWLAKRREEINRIMMERLPDWLLK